MDLLSIADDLAEALGELEFGPPVTHVYNPSVYARLPYERYVKRFARVGCEAVLLGMNPGPWGMAQTGIPFGEVQLARDWLGVEDRVGQPRNPHPKRPVDGFGCTRREVSGRRLWGWARAVFETPERFFERFFVLNYCPLVFMGETGRNLTPDKLRVVERRPLLSICDAALRRTIESLRPSRVIGVGRFAAQRAASALATLDVEIGCILHPSPASPAANRGWSARAHEQLEAMGIALPKAP